MMVWENWRYRVLGIVLFLLGVCIGAAMVIVFNTVNGKTDDTRETPVDLQTILSEPEPEAPKAEPSESVDPACHPHITKIFLEEVLASWDDYRDYTLSPKFVKVRRCFPLYCDTKTIKDGCCRPEKTDTVTFNITAYNNSVYDKTDFSLTVEDHVSCSCHKINSNTTAKCTPWSAFNSG